MNDEIKRFIEKLITRNVSFATFDNNEVFVWLNSDLEGVVQFKKIRRLSKALKLAHKIVGLKTVFLYYGDGPVGFEVNKDVSINMAYGKTIKGLTYTLIHEASHAAVHPYGGHGRRWRAEMLNYYPENIVVAGIASGIPWPIGVSKAPLVRRIVVLNKYMK